MLADMSDCIIECAIPFTLVRRRGSTAVVMGRVQEPTREQSCPTGTIHVSSGKDLKMLPEGMRTEEAITIYTIDKLYSGEAPDPEDPALTVYPDHILYEDEEYEVKNVAPWKKQGNFYVSIAVKVGQ